MGFTGSISGAFQKLRHAFIKKPDTGKDVELEYLHKRVIFLEQLLEEKNDCIEKAKSSFLKNLYHEIRTPLNAIIGFSDLIELNNIRGHEKDEYVKHIRESSREFLRKMDNIIEASIIEAGLLKIQKEQCRLHELMSEIHSYFSLHKHITEKHIAFLLSIPGELKKTEVICDIFRLTQVLTHLINNAFKYTFKGVVEIGCAVEDKNLLFFVKDSGIGGLEGLEATIFKNFSKKGDVSEEQEGLGLGLGLSKSIVEQMGGTIWYESLKEKGTTFYFTIPYQPVYVKRRKRQTVITRDLILSERLYKRSVIV
ncbi:MAG: hypothetical protein JW801_09855 [Bacteroidales bacterium]|nr:hypothetical protein [Bacteroidales bacterium]